MAENPAVGKMFTAVVINPTDHYIFALPGEYIFVGDEIFQYKGNAD